MGRKPKSESAEPLVITVADERGSTEEMLVNGDLSQTETVVLPLTIPNPIEKRVAIEMDWALQEILRCNDYIFAKADYDRRFSTYRDELYEYRYKIRQLSLLPSYPNISESQFPIKPDYVPDV